MHSVLGSQKSIRHFTQCCVLMGRMQRKRRVVVQPSSRVRQHRASRASLLGEERPGTSHPIHRTWEGSPQTPPASTQFTNSPCVPQRAQPREAEPSTDSEPGSTWSFPSALGLGWFVTQQETCCTPLPTPLLIIALWALSPSNSWECHQSAKKMRLWMKHRLFTACFSLLFLPRWIVEFPTAINSLWGDSIPSGTGVRGHAGYPLFSVSSAPHVAEIFKHQYLLCTPGLPS